MDHRALIPCRCGACDAEFSVSPEFLGQSVSCVQCGSRVAVEDLSKAAPARPSAQIPPVPTTAAANRRRVLIFAGLGLVASLLAAVAIWHSKSKAAMLVIEIPESRRAAVQIFLDDAPHIVPPSGPIEYVVAPGSRRVKIVYAGRSESATFPLEAGQRHVFRPSLVH